MLKKILVLLFTVTLLVNAKGVIRFNQAGYLPESEKSLLILSDENIEGTVILFNNYLSGAEETQYTLGASEGEYGNFGYVYHLYFGELQKEGLYEVVIPDFDTVTISVNKFAYNKAADFLLNYMRQQRCGYNPYLDDSCHTGDGFVIYHPEKDSTIIDVTGGWHDASDYLQYVTTSANAVYRMLFAYEQNPEAFGDEYQANGTPGSNGIPDILDEAKWGLDWLYKMNPARNEMYNQIADDRDHLGFRLPTEDTVNYGMGKHRPVYFCTGEPQGVFQNKNRADGIASTAGKYASAFALGSRLLNEYYPEFCSEIAVKAEDAFEWGEQNPGVCQTAPCRSPYFYEEDNWVDDMELAAASLAEISGVRDYNSIAAEYGRKELTTPWMGADTANHYQWYPFSNLGHNIIAEGKGKEAGEFREYIRNNLLIVQEKADLNPLGMGIPFIWCSNNLISELLNQLYMYKKLTGDDSFDKLEAVHRDWLFGANPWGTSMIVGYPGFADFPSDPHSALTHVYGYPVNGGLVDGPVYATIFGRLRGLQLGSPDEYADYQSDYIVYHDDWGDYSTNEPTMDGTASLTLYFGSLYREKEDNNIMLHGGIIRGDTTAKKIALVFTGHEFADGGSVIPEVLRQYDAKANFFLTGDFMREEANKTLINKLIAGGHYVGAHSDEHLLYADWKKRDSTLVTRENFIRDIRNNYTELTKFGIDVSDAHYYLPSYEWYNTEIAEWTESMGLQLINYTPGTLSAADYTYPAMGERYRNSEVIYNSIIEEEEQNSLNGFILLMHLGTDPGREDKFYNKLPDLLKYLAGKGYNFVTVDNLFN